MKVRPRYLAQSSWLSGRQETRVKRTFFVLTIVGHLIGTNLASESDSCEAYQANSIPYPDALGHELLRRRVSSSRSNVRKHLFNVKNTEQLTGAPASFGSWRAEVHRGSLRQREIGRWRNGPEFQGLKFVDQDDSNERTRHNVSGILYRSRGACIRFAEIPPSGVLAQFQQPESCLTTILIIQ